MAILCEKAARIFMIVMSKEQLIFILQLSTYLVQVSIIACLWNNAVFTCIYKIHLLSKTNSNEKTSDRVIFDI